jgi:hypothetical protein
MNELAELVRRDLADAESILDERGHRRHPVGSGEELRETLPPGFELAEQVRVVPGADQQPQAEERCGDDGDGGGGKEGSLRLVSRA